MVGIAAGVYGDLMVIANLAHSTVDMLLSFCVQLDKTNKSLWRLTEHITTWFK